MSLALACTVHQADGAVQAGPMTFTVESACSGHMLKQRLQYFAKAMPDSQTVAFSGPDGKDVEVEDQKTLAQQGLSSTNAEIRIFVTDSDDPNAKSALRNNIAKNGGSSYYYAHKDDIGLPAHLRFVSGGDPIPLDAATGLSAASVDDVNKARQLGESGAPGADQRTGGVAAVTVAAVLKRVPYSWCDDGKKVKVYITADDCVDAAKTSTDLKFASSTSLTLDLGGTHVLKLSSLERSVDRDKSTTKLTGSKCTLVLWKAEEESHLKWFNLLKA